MHSYHFCLPSRKLSKSEHCWRSRDELISDVLLWTPTYGRAKAERPPRTYIQKLCKDTGCSPEDLPEAMNDREKWRERVRDIRVATRHDDDDDDSEIYIIPYILSFTFYLVSFILYFTRDLVHYISSLISLTHPSLFITFLIKKNFPFIVDDWTIKRKSFIKFSSSEKDYFYVECDRNISQYLDNDSAI